MMHFLFLAVAKFSIGEERRQSAFTIFYHYLFLNKLIEKKNIICLLWKIFKSSDGTEKFGVSVKCFKNDAKWEKQMIEKIVY